MSNLQLQKSDKTNQSYEIISRGHTTCPNVATVGADPQVVSVVTAGRQAVWHLVAMAGSNYVTTE